MRLIRLALLLLVLVATAAAAAGSPGPYFWPPALDVTIFKDGCAYIVREGEVDVPADGIILTEKTPRPVLGTLDVYSPTEGVRVAEVVALHDEVAKTAPITDVAAFYRAQIGRKVVLEYGEEKVEGVLRAVLNPGHLLVETPSGQILVPMGAVTKLTLAGGASLEVPTAGREARYRIRLAGAPRRVKLGLSYLEESWSWVPGYRVNLRPNDQAEVVLTANVINNAEDVHQAVLHLVVGQPNFMMRGTLSPMVLDVDAGTYAKAYAPASPALAQAFGSNVTREYRGQDEADALSPAAPAGALEDLFVYEKKGFTLGRGQRMQLELFRGVVPCTSVYKWEIGPPDPNQTYNQRYLQGQGKISGEMTGQIWHHLRLTNKTAVPWTTAPAMVVSGWQPVAQDLMRYTNLNADIDLRVTVAPEVRGQAKEEEIARKPVRLYNNDDYLLITVKGTLALENLKKNAVKLEITKDLWGEVKENGGARAVKKPEYYWGVNPRTALEWKLDLPAGAKKTLTYTYEIYINI